MLYFAPLTLVTLAHSAMIGTSGSTIMGSLVEGVGRRNHESTCGKVTEVCGKIIQAIGLGLALSIFHPTFLLISLVPVITQIKCLKKIDPFINIVIKIANIVIAAFLFGSFFSTPVGLVVGIALAALTIVVLCIPKTQKPETCVESSN